ncbi:Serine/threonine kinase anti-sigma factor [Frankia sp. AiPs1]|uniref:ATP-binding protein n=1 Tax=Frankia sp. AiPa1 TaxID=573492 RepID=UPI00202B2182|nr:ATP-binding protein [Frankia sp. AiPa1]MCL9762980.1 ATP-binding protein [Frankia sp. AiPa1]
MTAALAPTPPTAPDPPANRLPLPRHVWHYPAAPRSASAARRDATVQLHRWGLTTLIGLATLVVSELITNALVASNRHGLHHAGEAVPRVAMRLTYSHRDLIIEVWDSGPGHPSRRTTDTHAEDGRGLHLVAALARDFGSCPVRVRTPGGYRTAGKIVWAALPHGAQLGPNLSHGPAEQLPRRDPTLSTGRGTPRPDRHDHALLHRVLDGLRTLDVGRRVTTPAGSVEHPTGREQETTP